MNQDMNSLLTGLATSLDKYMGLGIQNQLEQQKEVRANEAKKGLIDYQAGVDLKGKTAFEVAKLAIEGKVDAETAYQQFPEAKPIIESFYKQNNRYPTVNEAEKLLKPLEQKHKTTAEKLPKEFQFTAAGRFKRVDQAITDLANLEKKGFDVTGFGAVGRYDGPGESFVEGLKGDDWKSFNTIRKGIAEAYLRKETGAAISVKEYGDVDKLFIPQRGDGTDVLAQKATNRENLRNSLRSESEGKTVDLNTIQTPQASSKTSNDGWSYVGPVGG